MNLWDSLASKLSSYPTDLSGLPKDKMNISPLTARSKAKLLEKIQEAYSKRGKLSPIEMYGYSTEKALAQNDLNE